MHPSVTKPRNLALTIALPVVALVIVGVFVVSRYMGSGKRVIVAPPSPEEVQRQARSAAVVSEFGIHLKAGALEKVQAMAKSHPELIDKPSHVLYDPLLRGHENIVNWYLDKYGHQIKDEKEKNYLLAIAISSPKDSIFKSVLALGFDLKRKESWDDCLLHRSVHRHNSVAAELLLDAGWPIDQRTRSARWFSEPDVVEWTPLMYAAYRGNEPVVKLLVSRGADRDFVNYQGKSAFSLAIDSGSKFLWTFLNEPETLFPAQAQVNQKPKVRPKPAVRVELSAP